MVGNELNKEYATIKLEGQDVATLNSLVEEKELKLQTLNDIAEDNNSDIVKGLLSNLLENEKRYQEKLLMDKKKKEEEKKEKERLEELKRKEEMAIRQKALEEERKKEIEKRTKQLLVEKKNPVLISPNEDKEKTIKAKVVDKNKPIIGKTVIRREEVKPNFISKKMNSDDVISRRLDNLNIENEFPKINEMESNKGIPTIKNIGVSNKVVETKETFKKEEDLFPKLDLDKKENIFPDFSDFKSSNSFFDENEFNDLNDFMEDEKKGWF